MLLRGLRLAAAAAVSGAAAAAGAAPSPGVIVTEAGGAVTDGSPMWSVFAMGEYSGWPRSFSLSDTGSFGRLAWGIGSSDPLGVADYATQGSLIAEKLLALGTDTTRAIVRGWLAKAVLAPDGRAFGTEGSEFHGGGQGAFEGNAELLLIARHYAAHTGDADTFNVAPERFVCYTDATGAAHLAGAPHPGLDDSVCAQPPSEVLGSSASFGWRFYPESAFLAPYNQTIGNATVHATVHAHGKAPLQYLALPDAATSLSFALLSSAPPQARWPLVVTVVETAFNTVVRNGTLDQRGGPSGWATFNVTDPATGEPLPSGMYIVIIAFDPLLGGGEGGGMALPQWVIDARPASPGGSSYQTFLGWDVADPLAQWTNAQGQVELPPVKHLAAQLQTALWWQLNNCAMVGGAYDVLTITDPIFSGSNEAAKNSGSSYYDLFRMGFVASYINLRFLESLIAYQEMQAAGLVPSDTPSPSELATIIGQVRAAITARFTLPSGGILAWYGCTASNDTSTLCPLSDVTPATTNPAVQPWDLGFLPSQALALKLGVGTGPSTLARLRAMRDAARVQPGQFRTNTIPFESVSPMLWLAADRWDYKDAAGFAIREAKQTGDWMIFSPSTGPADGNGNFGLQEENGGVLLSTGSFVMEAGDGGVDATAPPPNPALPFTPRSGPYPSLYADWAGFVAGLANISAQLAAGDTSAPLLAGNRGFLRARMNATLIQDLCAAPRGGGALTNKDPWGDAWCDYYKSVSFDLPEAGLPLWSFARGLLGMYVDAGGHLTVLGNPLPARGGYITVGLPDGWPKEVSSVTVNGLALGTARGVSVTCSVMADVGALQCTSAEPSAPAAAAGRA